MPDRIDVPPAINAPDRNCHDRHAYTNGQRPLRALACCFPRRRLRLADAGRHVPNLVALDTTHGAGAFISRLAESDAGNWLRFPTSIFLACHSPRPGRVFAWLLGLN